jgi:hypothetical protein
MLQASGFRTISRERALCPFGTLCDVYTGLRGSPLHSLRGKSVESFVGVVDFLSQMLLRRGKLEAPLGVPIASEEGRRKLLEELRRCIHDGVLIVMSEWVAQKL